MTLSGSSYLAGSSCDMSCVAGVIFSGVEFVLLAAHYALGIYLSSAVDLK